MNRAKRIIIPIAIIFISNTLVILATYIENLSKFTRVFIGLVYCFITTITIILTYKNNFKNK